MDVFRVAFIGHREVDDFRLIEERLDEIIRNLIDTKEYVEFYVGRNGEFDIMVASAVKRAQRGYGNANNPRIGKKRIYRSPHTDLCRIYVP